MGLQFVFGGSGAGKSTLVYDKIIKQSILHPEQNFFVMVPDQFTMYTQKQLCMMHPRGGIMNIDVLSFSRLIHRIADEVGQKERVVLDDTGKNLILRKVAIEKETELVLLKDKLKKPGYIHEVKSMISEFYQYDIHSGELDEMIGQAEGKGALSWKLRDLKVLYDGFAEYIKEKYITTEEALEDLCRLIPRSDLLKGSVIVFDGFTGFTPIQNRVISHLMETAEEVIVTLCGDSEKDLADEQGQQHLFALSKKTYDSLSRLAEKGNITLRKNIFLSEKPVKRYTENSALAFLEAELFRYHQTTYRGTQDSLHVWETGTPLGELQKVCVEIKKLIREEGMCYRDIAVVTGDLGRYAHLIENEFGRYQIPYFLDQNRGVAFHPLTEYLKGALSLLKENFSYEAVFRFLRCGMTGLSADETDRLENYVRAHGIRGRKAYERTFVRGEDAREMDVLRSRMMEELSPVFVRCKNAREYTMAVFELCRKNRLQKKCIDFARQFADEGDLSKAKEYEKIYPACMDLLDQIYQLIGEDEMDVEEFIHIFEAGISEIQIGTIPQNVDQVVIGDIERTRLKAIKALFFIGVNDGVIPGSGGSGGLLSDMERQFLQEQGRELAPTPRQKIYEQRLYLYQNMTKPADRLYLSYSMVDGSGKSALPSYLIRILTGLYPELQIEKEDGEKEGYLAKIATREDGLDDFAQLLRMYLGGEMPVGSRLEVETEESLKVLERAYEGDDVAEKIKEAALATYENKPLSKTVAKLLYEDRNKGSVSRLELFASCSYAHFLRYGLELARKEEYDFEAIDFGTVYHGVLEQFFGELKKQKLSLANISEDEIKEILGHAMESCAREYGDTILYSSARNEHRISQMETVLLQSIRGMQYQQKKGNFEPAFFEQKFRLSGEFPLVGKIDRIDLYEENNRIYVKVVDYKSGMKKFSLDELYYGLSLQLPVYMNAAMSLLSEKNPQAELVAASMLYYRLQNPYVEDTAKDVETELYKKLRPDGLTVDEGVIELLDRDFETDSDVICVSRKKDGSFKSSSQILSSGEFQNLLSYTEKKTRELMGKILDGEIGVNPVQIEGAAHDSCSYCPYHEVCRMDGRIPGYGMKKLPKVTDEMWKEGEKDGVHKGPAESN